MAVNKTEQAKQHETPRIVMQERLGGGFAPGVRLIGETGVSYKRLNFMAGCLAQRSWDADTISPTQPVTVEEIALLDPETGIKSPALEVLVDNDIDWGRKGTLLEGALLGFLEPETSR